VKILFIREASTLYRYSNTSYGLGLVGTICSEFAAVRIIDNNSLHKFYTIADLLNEIETYRPDVIGFNVHAFNILASTRLIAAIKDRFPGVCLIAGGLHTYSEPGEVEETGVHVVVKGEADCTIKPLMTTLHRYVGREQRFFIDKELGRELSEISGLCFRMDGRSGLVDTGSSELLLDLDQLPFVDYDLFNLHDYLKGPGDGHYVTNVLITQRGCPFPCPFCRIQTDTAATVVRENSTEYRLKYVKYLQSKYNPEHLIFYDNNFTLNRGSAIDFCREFAASGFAEKMSFSCQTNVVLKLDGELLKTMKEANCKEVGLGIERLSQRALRLIKKNKDYENILFNIDMLNKHEIDVLANCLVGFPFDTAETVKEESRLFDGIEDKIRVFAINNLLPPPGTEVYQQTRYKRWYLEERFMEWRPSFYHMVYNFSNNAWDVNFFDLDAETQDSIREMKERFYSKTIEKMNSPVLNWLHFFERLLAKLSLAIYRDSPKIEEIVFYPLKKVRIALHGYFLTKYYVARSAAMQESDL